MSTNTNIAIVREYERRLGYVIDDDLANTLLIVIGCEVEKLHGWEVAFATARAITPIVDPLVVRPSTDRAREAMDLMDAARWLETEHKVGEKSALDGLLVRFRLKPPEKFVRHPLFEGHPLLRKTRDAVMAAPHPTSEQIRQAHSPVRR